MTDTIKDHEHRLVVSFPIVDDPECGESVVCVLECSSCGRYWTGFDPVVREEVTE